MLRYLLTYIVYKTDIETSSRNTVSRCMMHLYADDTQLYDHLRVNKIERSVTALEACLQDIVQWSSQRRLKLDPSKTELIWFWLDRGHSIKKLQQQPLIRLNSQELSSSPSVRDLGVIIDSGLFPSCKNVFLSVAKNSTGEEKLCQNISPCTGSLTSGLYCNSVLANVPEVTLAPLIRIQQHSAARLRKRRLFIRRP